MINFSVYKLKENKIVNLSVLCLLLVLLQAQLVLAEGKVSKPLIKVRSVRALGMLDDDALKTRDRIIIDTRLRDLDTELHALPFQMYQLLDSGVFPVSVRKKQDIRLATGQVLKLRLLSSDDDGLTIWLRWAGKTEGVLLDTRLHLEYGHIVLAGTESINRSGAVLAIEALKADPSVD